LTDAAGNQRLCRYEFDDPPILVEIPDLSLVMLEPKNISWGGFEVPEGKIDTLGAKVNPAGLLRHPEPGMRVDCGLEVMDQDFQGLVAEIPWVAADKENPSAWTFGLRIAVPEDQLAGFRSAMKRSFFKLRPEKLPQPRAG